MNKDVIAALDFPSAAETLDFLDLFAGEGEKPYVKVGMELFYSEGPGIIREIKRRGHRIFLDLKVCDIPNTVRRTMQALSALHIDMANVHASGATEMMKAALEGLGGSAAARPLLIAVTQLTSTDDRALHEDLLIPETMERTVMHYADVAARAGLDGVVCSPREARQVKACCGEGFVTVTPGIRFADSVRDDQKRIMTPAEARVNGCDYLVVGRPITNAADPVAAYDRCVREFLRG